MELTGKSPVDSVAEASEQDTMRTCVLGTSLYDILMYHLVNECAVNKVCIEIFGMRIYNNSVGVGQYSRLFSDELAMERAARFTQYNSNLPEFTGIPYPGLGYALLPIGVSYIKIFVS